MKAHTLTYTWSAERRHWNSPAWAYLKIRLSELHPAYFAMAMATGIVSIACEMNGLHKFAQILYWVNMPGFCILWLMNLARFLFFRKQFIEDWTSHQRGPGFFTAVAATCVVGSQLCLFTADVGAGRVLWWVAVVLWTLCIYSVFVLLSIQEKKPSLADGINGGWLVSVVATQAVALLGCVAGPRLFGSLDISLFFLMSFWLFGGMLYIWMISLIFYRYMFFRLEPSDLMPPYWINMGAVAISTLTGTALVSAAQNSPMLLPIVPFLKGLTMMFWATATWWIPMLVILGVWRYHIKNLSLNYDPLYWGLVFPLGMYSACTYGLAEMLQAPFLTLIAKVFVVLALIAWGLAFLGMAKRFLYFILLSVRVPNREWTRVTNGK